jgi:molecular chaperone HtpG
VGAELPARLRRHADAVGGQGRGRLGKLQDETEKKAAEEAAEAFKPLLAKLKEALKDKAEDVRLTTRLVDSPACLVVQDPA